MTDTSITNFLSAFPEGWARPNRYKIRFQLPKGINDFGNWMNTHASAGNIGQYQWTYNNNGKIDIGCHTANLPNRTLLTATHKQIGGPFNIPFSHTYDPVTFSFYADKNLNVREYFEVWQSAVINITDNSVNFWNEYVSDIDIIVLDRKGNESYKMTLYDCYPLAIGDVNLSYASQNELLNITVTMMYRLWKSEHDTTTVISIHNSH